uniref:LYR motif-containing protein 2 n=1 Tax=Cyprinus carpio TaxID=7962 RepID=A0A8C2AJA6_CYPCA
MAVSRLPPAALSLKQFLQRQKVLGVYRDLLRSIRKIPIESDRRYLRDWAREEFKRNKSETDQWRCFIIISFCPSITSPHNQKRSCFKMYKTTSV